jgi:hypothetical protein
MRDILVCEGFAVVTKSEVRLPANNGHTDSMSWCYIASVLKELPDPSNLEKRFLLKKLDQVLVDSLSGIVNENLRLGTVAVMTITHELSPSLN